MLPPRSRCSLLGHIYRRTWNSLEDRTRRSVQQRLLGRILSGCTPWRMGRHLRQQGHPQEGVQRQGDQLVRKAWSSRNPGGIAHIEGRRQDPHHRSDIRMYRIHRSGDPCRPQTCRGSLKRHILLDSYRLVSRHPGRTRRGTGTLRRRLQRGRMQGYRGKPAQTFRQGIHLGVKVITTDRSDRLSQGGIGSRKGKGPTIVGRTTGDSLSLRSRQVTFRCGCCTCHIRPCGCGLWSRNMEYHSSR